MANLKHGKNAVNIVENQHQVAVVVVPFVTHGHLNSLLHLSLRISAYNIPVYYVNTAANIGQVKARLDGWDPSAITNLHFHEIPTPPLPLRSPDLDSASVKQAFRATLSKFDEPVFMLVNKLSSGDYRRVIVVFDPLIAGAVVATRSLPNVESYSFEAASIFSSFSLNWQTAGKPDIPAEAGIMKELPSVEECFAPELLRYMESQRKARNLHSGTIYNTSKIIEGLYLDLLAKTGLLGPEKPWALGPFNPVFGEAKDDSKSSHSMCLEWLDKQPPNSVIFVSFGSLVPLSAEQIRELAVGLERSEQRFIWALKDTEGADDYILPQGGFEERGTVVRDWAPQLEILKHRATGGFLSHCGWNSCIESISMGVPIAAWPMALDQPTNSVLITKVLKIGVEVRDWARRDEVVSSVTIEEAVKRLMASAEGDEMRQRAKELADSIEQSMMEGGEMDSFIAHISR